MALENEAILSLMEISGIGRLIANESKHMAAIYFRIIID